MLKYGDPLAGREYAKSIEDAFERYTVADGDCLIWTGSKSAGVYGTVWHDGRYHQAHRLAWELANGPIPNGMFIDHKCHRPLCVNTAHLRPVTPGQNNQNIKGVRKDSSTGIRGVSFQYGKYKAHVRHQGVLYHLGTFDTAEAAGEAARQKRLELFTHNDMDRREDGQASPAA